MQTRRYVGVRALAQTHESVARDGAQQRAAARAAGLWRDGLRYNSTLVFTVRPSARHSPLLHSDWENP